MAKNEAKCKGGMLSCGLVGSVLMVIGFYSIILGVKTQWMSSIVYNNWMAMLYYLVGIILVTSVKMHMMHAHCVLNGK